MTCIEVTPLYYLEHKRIALLDLNPAVRDNRLILRVNFSFHAPRDAASGRKYCTGAAVCSLSAPAVSRIKQATQIAMLAGLP